MSDKELEQSRMARAIVFILMLGISWLVLATAIYSALSLVGILDG